MRRNPSGAPNLCKPMEKSLNAGAAPPVAGKAHPDGIKGARDILCFER